MFLNDLDDVALVCVPRCNLRACFDVPFITVSAFQGSDLSVHVPVPEVYVPARNIVSKGGMNQQLLHA